LTQGFPDDLLLFADFYRFSPLLKRFVEAFIYALQNVAHEQASVKAVCSASNLFTEAPWRIATLR
jgi:hypothetical protein